MPVGIAVLLGAIFAASGVLSYRTGVKTEKKAWKLTGVASVFISAGCIGYLITTLLLLGGIA